MAVYKRGKNYYIDFTFHGERIREIIGPSKKGAQKVIDKRKGEIQRLLSNCADHLKPIVTVALHTGMKKSELLNLKWEQVNLEQSIISLLDTKNHERRDIHE